MSIPEAAASPEPTARAKPSRGRFLLRCAVSVALLAVLIAKTPNLDGVIPEGNHFRTVALLGLAAFVTLVGVVLSAWRWQRVLDVLGSPVGLGTLTAHTLAGLFVGNVLPSTIGGDVLRVTRTSTTVGSSETAFASVALERLTGFVALPLLVFVGFAADPHLIDHNHSWIALAIGCTTLGLLASILFAAGHPRLAGRFAGRANWVRFIGAVHVGVDRLRRDPKAAFGVLATAVLYQSAVVASVAIIVTTLELHVPIAAVVAFVPAVAMVQVVVPTVNGLGAREGMLVLFLTPFHVHRGAAIATGLLWYASVLLVSLLGAPVFAAGNHKRAAREPREATESRAR